MFAKKKRKEEWRELLVSIDEVLAKVKPGMRVFLSTGAAEPRGLVNGLMRTETKNLYDLELIQLVSFGDVVSLKSLNSQKYRLKTFFSGWVASEAIVEGRVDLIPSRSALVPHLIKSGKIPIDIAFIQITPPDKNGYCSLGISVDAARQAMDSASIVVGEINSTIPFVFGNTLVPLTEFDYLVTSTEPPFYFQRWGLDETIDMVAANVASVIKDRSCLSFSIGTLFEGLSRHLTGKKDLGIHSMMVTDALMDLIKSGAVSNRYQKNCPGKSLASYVLGTPELMEWLHRNPLVELQSVDKVLNPLNIGKNPRFVAVIPARKVDLSGRIVLHSGKGNIAAGPEGVMDIFNGAEMSMGGQNIFALPSRNLEGKPNIKLSVEEFPNQFSLRESVDMVVTEYGIASLKGCTVRERAQFLIDIAHPDDRLELVERAKEKNILYQDQIFLEENAQRYPSEISTKHTFKGDVEVLFRAIKPSDEEQMRRLFYRFSDEAVYYRYFAPIKAMPHSKTQSYVNLDYRRSMSVVGLVGEGEKRQIIAEARYVTEPDKNWAEVAFVVDEEYQGIGIATYLYKMLIRIAKERGIEGFTAQVLASNKGMMNVFKKGSGHVNAQLTNDVMALSMPFQNSYQ